MSRELEDAVRKSNEQWEKLEEVIVALVKEHYRLSGRVVYEPVDPELEAEIKGEG